MKSKVVFLFVFLALFSFVISSFSFAVTIDFLEVDGKQIDASKVEFTDRWFMVWYYGSGSLANTKIYTIYVVKDDSSVNASGSGVYIDGSVFCYSCYNSQNSFSSMGSLSGVFLAGTKNVDNFIYSSFDILNSDGSVYYGKNYDIVNNPSFVNKEQITTGKFDKIVINSGEYNHYGQQTFDFYSYYYSTSDVVDYNNLGPRVRITLDGPSNQYFVGSNDTGDYIYEIPLSATGIDLVEGNRYGFKLAVGYDDNPELEDYPNFVDEITFDVGVVSTEEKEQIDRDKQLETSKNIFDTLKDVLSYINPLSENFFVYKLIDLLVEAIKSLFIPSDEFFTNWATDMNDWLSDRLGILYFPVDMVVKFLEKIGEISDSGNAVISWSNFSFMGADLIKAGSYDLNNLVASNPTIKNVHDIYLVFTDVILWLGLCVLAKNTFVDIFGGKYDDTTDIIETGVSSSMSNARSYKNYERYRGNRERYDREHGGRK